MDAGRWRSAKELSRKYIPVCLQVYIEAQQSTVSFSYADLLTREVEVQLESSGESLF